MSGSSHDHERFFRFLRRLRSEGRTNMYGAVPYLMRTFALDRDRAFKTVCDWVDQQVETASVGVVEAKAGRKSARRRVA